MEGPLAVLLVEDSEDDALLIGRALRRSPRPVALQRVQALAELDAALARGGWDLVLSDHSLGTFTGQDVLERVRATGEDLPFILVSGAIGEERAAEIMRLGAKDFIRKDRLERLLPTIERELGARETRKQHAASEAALRESERRFAEVSALMGELIWEVDAEGLYTYLGPACRAMLGYGVEELVGRLHFYDLHPEAGREAFKQAALALFARRERFQDFPNPIRAKDGRLVEVLTNAIPMLDEAGNLRGYRGADRDVTERRRVEEEHRRLEVKLQQAEKLESLGILAGGVAHDINNVLAAILSLATAHRPEAEGSSLAEALDTIALACTRGRDVVKHLLAFARQDLETSTRVDLNVLVRDLVQLLDHTTLKRIRLETRLREPLPPLQGDPGTLSHALMNLCVNAVDAMPGGGELVLSTDVPVPGQVELRVKDTGYGMAPEVAARVLEPFFTTKPVGRGTGLGLSMVYGTVKAHGGTLDLFSRPGEGTEVVLRFPAQGEAAPAPATGTPMEVPEAAVLHRVLLVDDDELVRMSVAQMLEMDGCTVDEAEGGAEALARLGEGSRPDLVLLDLNMPGMSGAETLEGILALNPGQAVILSSGYSDQDVAALLAERPNVASIQKPYTLPELQQKLRLVAAWIARAES